MCRWKDLQIRCFMCYIFCLLCSCIVYVVPLCDELHWTEGVHWVPVWDCPLREWFWGWGFGGPQDGSNHCSAQQKPSLQRRGLNCGPDRKWGASLHNSGGVLSDRKEHYGVETPTENKRLQSLEYLVLLFSSAINFFIKVLKDIFSYAVNFF